MLGEDLVECMQVFHLIFNALVAKFHKCKMIGDKTLCNELQTMREILSVNM